MTSVIVWIAVLIVTLALEAASVQLTSIWFSVGSIAALIAAIIRPQAYLAQLIIFVAVSVICLVATRPLVKKAINRKKQATNADAVIGKQGIVLEEVNNTVGRGRVKIGSSEWTARSLTGETIPEGALVNAVRIEGVKLIVEQKA